MIVGVGRERRHTDRGTRADQSPVAYKVWSLVMEILEIVGVAVVIIVVLEVILGSLILLGISTINPHLFQRNK